MPQAPELLPGPRYQSAARYQVQAVFFDIDNTLVGNESMDLPSKRFIDQARAAKGRLHIGIASARQLAKVKHILDAIESDGLSILCNGAQIYDGRTGVFVQEWLIPQPACDFLFKQLASTSIRYWVNDDGVDRDPRQEPDYRPVKPFVFVLKEITKAEVELAEAWVADFGDDDITCFVAHQKSHEDGWRYDVFVTHKYANKRTALHNVAELMQISIEHIAAVGDGRNDVVMVGGAGVGIAMGNAAQETLDAATFIAPEQFNDGAADALEFLVTLV